MNPKNLQAITDIISGLGEDAKTAFIWYLGTTVVNEIIYASTCILCLYMIIRLIRYGIDN